MKKAFIVFLILCLALASIAPKYIGIEAERGFKAYFHNKAVIALQQYGLSLELLQYERGYFTSQARVALSIPSQTNTQALFADELIVDITHAPLSLSGIHLLDAEIVNHGIKSGALSQTLPQNLIKADISVSLWGQVIENIELMPFTLTLSDFAVKDINFGGADIHWYGHLKDSAINGHGILTTPHIALQTRSGQWWRIDQLTAQLRRQDSTQTLNIEELNFSYHHPEQEVLNISANGIEQIQHFQQSEQQYLPLARELSIEQINVDFDNSPQVQINDLFGKIGLAPDVSDYVLVLDWQANVTRHEQFNAQQLPFFASLPAEQKLSLSLSPISAEQLPAWSYVIESFWQPRTPKAQSLANFGQLLRLNVANQHTILSFNTRLSDSDELLADADISIDENIDHAWQINALFIQGLNPKWFNDSYIEAHANQAWLRKLRLMPYLIFLNPKGLHIDDDKEVSLRAKIIDHQLLLNNNLSN